MKRITAIALLLLPLAIFAQDVEVKWGQDYGKKGTDFTPIGVSKDNKLIYPTQTLIERCKKYLSKKWWIEKTEYVNTPNHLYAGVTALHIEGKEKKLQLYFVDVDDNGLPKGTDKLIASNDYWESKSVPFNATSIGEGDAVGWTASEDKKMMVFIASPKIFDFKGEPEKFYITVFDENLKELWKKEQVFKYTDPDMTVSSFGVTNNGKVFLIARFMNEQKKVSDPQTYYRKIFIITSDGVKETSLDIGGDAVANSFHFESNNDDILFSGVYRKSSSALGACDGVFASVFNTTSCSFASPVLNPFSKNTLDQLKAKNYEFSDLIETNDGEHVMLLTTSGSVTTSTFGSTSSTHTRNFSGNSLLVGLSKEYKTNFETPLFSKLSINASYTGADICKIGDKIILLYNEGGVKHSFKYSVVNLKGEMEKQGEIALSNKEYFFVPGTTQKFANGKVAIGASPSDANGPTPVFVRGVLVLK